MRTHLFEQSKHNPSSRRVPFLWESLNQTKPITKFSELSWLIRLKVSLFPLSLLSLLHKMKSRLYLQVYIILGVSNYWKPGSLVITFEGITPEVEIRKHPTEDRKLSKLRFSPEQSPSQRVQRRFVQEEIQVRDIEELSTRRQARNMAYWQAGSFKPKDPRRNLETRSLTFSILLCLPRWIMKQLLPYKANHKTWRDACSVSRTKFQIIFWDCSFETIFGDSVTGEVVDPQRLRLRGSGQTGPVGYMPFTTVTIQTVSVLSYIPTLFISLIRGTH